MVASKYEVENVTKDDVEEGEPILASSKLLVAAARTALHGGSDAASRRARDLLKRHPDAVREAVARRTFPFLVAFTLLSACVFAGACAALAEPNFSRWSAEVTRSLHGCWPDRRDMPGRYYDGGSEKDDATSRCHVAWHGVRDSAVLALGAVALFAFLGFPVNAVVGVIVWEGEYNADLWWTWMLLHAVVAGALFFTLFLSPFGMMVYWTLQNMKMYAVTFGDSVPCTRRSRFI